MFVNIYRKCLIVREAQLSFHISRLELKIIDWMVLKRAQWQMVLSADGSKHASMSAKDKDVEKMR